MKLIINVDDVGLHPGVTRAVEILASKGVVTSASMVATGMDVESAAALQGISIGVHLDILRGRPLSHWQEVNTLVDENGAFFVSPVILFEKYAKGKFNHEQVEREWSAQIERVLDLGVKPTHLTSHKHIHGWPSLTRMTAGLANRYGIGWVRKPEECSEISRLDKSGIQARFQNVCNYFDREIDEVNWIDVYWSATDAKTNLTTETFLQYIDDCGDAKEGAVVELCCSPGITVAGDPPIPPECNPPEISAIWRNEFQSLAEGDWLQAIKDLGAQLTGYGEL